MITILDAQGDQVAANPSGAVTLGYPTRRRSLSEALSHVHPDDLPAAREQMRQVLTGHQVPPARFRVRAADGTWHWLESRTVELPGEGHARGQAVFSVDVTEAVQARERLEEAHAKLSDLVSHLHVATEQYRSLVEQLPGVTYRRSLTDPPEVLYLSPQAEELFGWSRLDRQGRVLIWAKIVHPDDLDRITGPVTKATWESHDVEYRVLSGDGRWRWVRDISRLITDEEGQPLFRQGIVFDVTEQRLVQEQRARLLKLERRAHRSAQQRAHRLAELDRAKDELVEHVSHELLTPLTSIMAYADLLADDTLTAVQRDQVSVVQRSARRINALVNDLLLLAQLDDRSLRLHLELLDPGPFVQSRVAEHAARAAGKRIAVLVRCVSGAAVELDRRRIGEVLDNLLVNAIKFTPEEGTVWVSSRTDAGWWQLVVEDTGPGVSPRERSRIFERFERGETARRSGAAGSGLGLAITKGVVDLHGGSITIGSAAGGGARFVVRLPISQKARPE